MSDLVERLYKVSSVTHGALMEEAAAEIERLKKALDVASSNTAEAFDENERLRDMCQNREEFIALRGLWKEFSCWLGTPDAPYPNKQSTRPTSYPHGVPSQYEND